MGLFDKLFGKKKNASEAEPINKKALGLKDDAEVVGEKMPDKASKQAVAAEKTKEPQLAKTVSKPVSDAAKAPKESTEKGAEAKKTATAAEMPKTPNSVPVDSAEVQKRPAKEEPVPVSSDDATQVKDVAIGGGRFEIKKSKDGRFVFNLYAKNHVIVATSQVYSSSAAAVNGIKSVIANAPIAAVEDQTLKNWQPQGFPKWEIYEDKGGQYRFRLSAPNGSCICHSQGYTNKVNCKNGIQSIIRSVKDASVDKAYLKKLEE